MCQKELPKFSKRLLNDVIKENGFIEYSVLIKPGSEVGDGFGSEMFSIAIVDQKSNEKIEVVCKIAPFSEIRRKEFLSNLVFSRETLFYNKIMPMFAKYQEERNVPEKHQFLSYPKCYAAVTDDDISEQHTIILEDLRPQGFKLWNKGKSASIENMRLALRELGKFHGISFAMKDQKQQEFAELKQITDVTGRFCQNMQNMFIAAFDRGIKSLKNDEHKNIMRHLKENFLSYFEDCISNETSDRFGVLSHGDFWSNNILFRFNEHNIADDIRILDWQTIRYVSPAVDVIYNIFTSTDKALRDKEYENLIELYYESLANTVKLLGSDPNELFTREHLKSELKRCGNYALVMAPMVIQVLLADSTEISNLDETLDRMAKGEVQQDLITGLNDEAQSKYDQRLKDVVGDIVELGYFNKIDFEAKLKKN